MTLSTGRHPVHTLGVGDRYLITSPDRQPLEMTAARIRRHSLTDTTTVYHVGSPDYARTYRSDALATITHRAPRKAPAEAFGLGCQSSASLGIGDRYIASGHRDKRYRREVTVSSLWDCVDGSFIVRHQQADPIRTSHYVTASGVHVTHRAPRCHHGGSWEACAYCAEVEWPAEIQTAYEAAAAPRA